MEDLATLRQAGALGVGAGRETRMKTWPPRHSASRPPPQKGEEGDRRASRPGNGPGPALDLAMLYPFPPTVGSSSPWGPIQHLTPLGPDAVAVSTASHGGIRVSLTALARIPEPLQATAYSGAGWFEEDCDWAIPYLALGLDAFEPDAARAAEVWAAAVHTVKRYHPQHTAVLGADADPEGRPHG